MLPVHQSDQANPNKYSAKLVSKAAMFTTLEYQRANQSQINPSYYTSIVFKFTVFGQLPNTPLHDVMGVPQCEKQISTHVGIFSSLFRILFIQVHEIMF